MKEEKNNKKKEKFFTITITVLVSMITLIFGVKLLLSNSRINEGKFRVTDVILSCIAEFEDTSDSTGRWTYNVSQVNELSLLIHSGTSRNITATITNFKSSNPNIVISEKSSVNEIKANENEKLELTTLLEEDSVLYEIKVINKNVLDNFELPQGITELTHNATVFSLANISVKDLMFTVSFDLNMQEAGKTYTMKISLELPYGNILENGSSVQRLDKSNYIFKLK